MSKILFYFFIIFLTSRAVIAPFPNFSQTKKNLLLLVFIFLFVTYQIDSSNSGGTSSNGRMNTLPIISKEFHSLLSDGWSWVLSKEKFFSQFVGAWNEDWGVRLSFKDVREINKASFEGDLLATMNIHCQELFRKYGLSRIDELASLPLKNSDTFRRLFINLEVRGHVPIEPIIPVPNLFLEAYFKQPRFYFYWGEILFFSKLSALSEVKIGFTPDFISLLRANRAGFVDCFQETILNDYSIEFFWRLISFCNYEAGKKNISISFPWRLPATYWDYLTLVRENSSFFTSFLKLFFFTHVPAYPEKYAPSEYALDRYIRWPWE